MCVCVPVAGGEKASVGTADGKFADEYYANAACARSNFIAVGLRRARDAGRISRLRSGLFASLETSAVL